MDTPFISFIVPAFNCAEELPLCVRSILRAELDDFEIVIVDDGSTDGTTPSLCDEFSRKHREITVIHHAANQGVGAARDTAIQAARGEYIFCVDSDDQIEPEAVKRFVSRKNKWRGAPLVCFNSLIDRSGQTIPLSIFSNEGWQTVDDMLKAIPSFLPDFMWQHMFNRKFLSQNQLCVPHLKSGEDNVFVAKVLLLSDCIYLSHDYLYRYYVRETTKNLSVNITLSQTVLRIETVRKTVFPLLLNRNISSEKKRMIDRYHRLSFADAIAHSSAEEFDQVFVRAEKIASLDGHQETVEEISNYWQGILAVLREKAVHSLFVCPAGVTGVGFAEKLLIAGAPLAGLLDNYRKDDILLHLPAGKETSCPVFPFQSLADAGKKGGVFVIVASVTQNAEMIRQQLEEMGFYEGESVLYL